MNNKVLTLCSGGLDSFVLVYYLLSLGYQPHLLLINYSQKPLLELDRALYLCRELQLEHTLLDLQALGKQWGNNTITGTIQVNPTASKKEQIQATVIPNRNLCLLSIASSLALASNIDKIATAIHFPVSEQHLDCTETFLNATQKVLDITSPGIKILAPFVNKQKWEVVQIGQSLGVQFQNSYSCYVGSWTHCGLCIACLARRQAFIDANIIDPTLYAN